MPHDFAPDPVPPLPQLEPLTLDNFPDLYSLTLDTYGTGVFVAWILAGCSAILQLAGSELGDADTLPFDFIATLAYPVVVAGHLIFQMKRYPGPKDEWWTTRDKEFVPYGVAIQAAVKVCLFALGVNACFGMWVYGIGDLRQQSPWKRHGLLSLSSLSIFIALCQVPSSGTHHFLSSFASIFITIFTLVSTVMLLWLLGLIAAATCKTAWSTVRNIIAKMGTFEGLEMVDILGRPVGTIACMGCLIVVGYLCWIWRRLWILVMPQSGHELGDLGQGFTAGIAGVSLGYTVKWYIKVWVEDEKAKGNNVSYPWIANARAAQY